MPQNGTHSIYKVFESPRFFYLHFGRMEEVSVPLGSKLAMLRKGCPEEGEVETPGFDDSLKVLYEYNAQHRPGHLPSQQDLLHGHDHQQ